MQDPTYRFLTPSGFTLIEVLVSILLLGAMLLTFQAVLLGTPLTRTVAHRELALSIATHQMETLRDGGYAVLPASGSFADPLLSELPSGSGTLAVTAYNAKTKRVVVTVAWTEPSGAQSVALTTLITETGGL